MNYFLGRLASLPKKKSQMKKNVLSFGGIMGAIMVGHSLYMVNVLCNNPAVRTNDVLGYAAMLVVFSLIFFGVRNYRNKELGGVISLGQAFKTGALIALLGSTMYVVAWLFYYYLVVPDFIDKYSEHIIIEATRKGATAAELAQKEQQNATFKDMYQNPLFVVLISYFEVLPIGLAVALVSSLVLKKKTRSAA